MTGARAEPSATGRDDRVVGLRAAGPARSEDRLTDKG